ncbi:uncharacterized protein LOC141730672 [Zonotrichia albicollis]|uniref:uncharacterized protein LOC141730672 n=1 Tax=Zonotrichia albicollis TaxID=44394 RepID=UPI003D812365
MRPNEQIPSRFAIANPSTGTASPAGREPNPILIAEHRSQEPLGITARVASVGSVPSQHSAEPPPRRPRDSPARPRSVSSGFALQLPRALERCRRPGAPGWQQGAMLSLARGTTAPLQALQSQIPPAMPVSGCIPGSGSCPPSLDVTAGPHRAGELPCLSPRPSPPGLPPAGAQPQLFREVPAGLLPSLQEQLPFGSPTESPDLEGFPP